MFNDFPVCLPLELERVIFEMSSYTGDDTKHLFNLMLVAKYVHDWIKPILYETVLQSQKTKIPDIQRFPAVDVAKVGKYSRNLLISEELSQCQITYLLSVFPNVDNLAIWTNRTDLADFQEREEFQRLPLRRLSVFVGNLARVNLSLPPFQRLTHLELIRSRHEPWPQWEPLTHLPHLTHVLVNAVIPPDIAEPLLERCPGLVCLVQLVSVYIVSNWSNAYRSELCAGGGDTRLVSMSYTTTFPFIRDWQEGARGGIDSWERADCISIARQKKYFTDCTPRWLPNDHEWTSQLNSDGWAWYLSRYRL